MSENTKTTNPCFNVPWEIAFEYGSDRSSNAWIITDGCVPGFPESEKRVGVILKDVPVELAKHIVWAHNGRLPFYINPNGVLDNDQA